MDMDTLRERLRSHLTFGIEGAHFDNKRLKRLAQKAGVSEQTIRNLLQGTIKRPQAKKLRMLISALQVEERNASKRKGVW